MRARNRHHTRRHFSLPYLFISFLLLLPLRAQTPPIPPTLQTVLNDIDHAAPHIRSVTADTLSDQYVALVDDHTIEKGRLYYHKTDHSPEMALHIASPAAKIFVYRDNTGWMYIPAAHQVQKYDLTHNRSLAEQFLLLGLGGSGHALLKSFRVTLGTHTTVDGIPAVELILIPLKADLARNITAIHIWYDTLTWVALRQKFLQPGGDYRELQYTHIELNRRVPDKYFNTHFPGATVITPQH